MHEDDTVGRDSLFYELTRSGKPNQKIGEVDILNRNSQMNDTRFRNLCGNGIVANGYNMSNPAFR